MILFHGFKNLFHQNKDSDIERKGERETDRCIIIQCFCKKERERVEEIMKREKGKE